MQLTDPVVMGTALGLSETGLLLWRRSKGASSADDGSLGLLWGVILSCIAAAITCTILIRATDSPLLVRLAPLGGALFYAGLLLRWYAILYLGRLFTVNVAIASDHRLVDSGPYRFIRHPSYSGALLAFLGMGMCYRNWLGVAWLTLPIGIAFMRRIRIEERALLGALGDNYARYRARTRRLIPFIY